MLLLLRYISHAVDGMYLFPSGNVNEELVVLQCPAPVPSLGVVLDGVAPDVLPPLLRSGPEVWPDPGAVVFPHGDGHDLDGRPEGHAPALASPRRGGRVRGGSRRGGRRVTADEEGDPKRQPWPPSSLCQCKGSKYILYIEVHIIHGAFIWGYLYQFVWTLLRQQVENGVIH